MKLSRTVGSAIASSLVAGTVMALAFSMVGPASAHDGEAQTVTKNFEAAIPNSQASP